MSAYYEKYLKYKAKYLELQELMEGGLKHELNVKTALIIVDPQYDFCTGGALPVSKAEEIFGPINEMRKNYNTVFITQDWHPKGHVSFKSSYPGYDKPVKTLRAGDKFFEQVLWPDHCVQGTNGAKFHELLNVKESDIIIKKGSSSIVDSYSGFGDQFLGKYERTELEDLLRAKRITRVIVCGLATDYCVSFTAKDAKKKIAGLEVVLIKEAARGVDFPPDNINKEIREMKELGVKVFETYAEYLAAMPEK